jgi:S1-C subfamily serine protease
MLFCCDAHGRFGGHVLTNAHVVKDCSEIRVQVGQGEFETGKLIAKDTTNDLALVKVNAKPAHAGALRFGVRLGESVEAFGYPLSQVLATSVTTGNVTALAGLGDDSRFFQISAPVQPGNSGGSLLDETAISSESSRRS